MNPKPRKAIVAEGFKRAFAERLKKLRERKKLTVEQLAEQSGIPRTTLFCWEAATRCPVNEQLLGLAEALGVKPGTLIPDR